MNYQTSSGSSHGNIFTHKNGTQVDPYYLQLQRQNTAFRERLREAGTSSNWNVFGQPRTYSTIKK